MRARGRGAVARSFAPSRRAALPTASCVRPARARRRSSSSGAFRALDGDMGRHSRGPVMELACISLLAHLYLIYSSSPTARARSSDGVVEFSHLNLVGQRWDNGGWGVLDDTGKQIGECTRGSTTKGCQQMWSPSQPPGLLRLSNSTLVCAANDSVYYTQNGGMTWTRNNSAGHPSRVWASVRSPAWMQQDSVWMDVSPIDVWPSGCSPKEQKAGAKCRQVVGVSAMPNRTYMDWSCDWTGGTCFPVAYHEVGRPHANTWSGLPEPVSMMCTSEGGGTQLLDGSYIFLASVTFASDALPGCNCNNSVVAFASTDALQWSWVSTVARFDHSKVYQGTPIST